MLFAAVAGVAPPDQEYVPPPVAVTEIDNVVQVKIVVPVLLVLPAVGGVIFCVIVIASVSVQPLAAVTVTVYVPGALKLFAAVAGVAPPDHEYVPPPVAVTEIAVVVQVSIVVPVLFVIPAVGGVIFCVIVIASVSVQ